MEMDIQQRRNTFSTSTVEPYQFLHILPFQNTCSLSHIYTFHKKQFIFHFLAEFHKKNPTSLFFLQNHFFFKFSLNPTNFSQHVEYLSVADIIDIALKHMIFVVHFLVKFNSKLHTLFIFQETKKRHKQEHRLVIYRSEN